MEQKERSRVKVTSPLAEVRAARVRVNGASVTHKGIEILNDEGEWDCINIHSANYNLISNTQVAEATEKILSESIIQWTPEREVWTGRSKKPDFLVIEGDTALVIECKALRYRRDLLTDSTPESLANAMDKVGGGLVQIQEFLDDNRETLFRGRRFKQFIPVVVTYGKTHMMQAPALQVPREKMLEKKNVQLREWHLLNVHELELLEPHLKAGEELSQVIKHISKRTFSEVYQEVSARTGKAFADSFLYSFVDDMFKTRNAINNVCKETKGER